MFALDLSRGPLKSSCVSLSASAPWSDDYTEPQNREAQAGISASSWVSAALGPHARAPPEPECP